MPMRNRALQVRMVKTDGTETPVPIAAIDPDQVNEIIKEQVTHVAKTIGTLLLAKKAADTASELILIMGRKYL